MSDSTSQSNSLPKSDMVRDIYLWRRKKVVLSVLLVSTAIWVSLQVYQLTLVTVASWVSMSIVLLLFLAGNLLKLLKKEEINLSALEITEETSIKTANSCCDVIEKGIKWMFHITVEREWFDFATTIGGLWLIAYVGRWFDLITLVYMGIVVGMTVPVIYVKYEDKINKGGEKVNDEFKRVYEKIENMVKNMKNKVIKEKEVKKDKKME